MSDAVSERVAFDRPLLEDAVWLSVHLDEDSQRAGGMAITPQTARDVAAALLFMAELVENGGGAREPDEPDD